MCSQPKFACDGAAFWQQGILAFFTFLLAIIFAPAMARAQQVPAGAIGHVEGNDISVESGTAAGSAATGAGFVFNGSVVTVHDGKARLMLAGGGQADVCGPAKFTLLQSGGSITLALNFGRVHLQIPAGTSLRIFTPTIIATPLDISGAARDITAGLDMNDSLCVLATNGAIRLEQQFTGEGLIVPQSGEFFLAAGKLVPIAGTQGSCQCDAMHAQSAPPPQIPVMGVSSAKQLDTQNYPTATDASAQTPTSPPTLEPEAKPNVTLRTLAQADEIHPVAPAAKDAVAPPPPTSMPEYKIILPPLGFSASSPSPPEDPPLDAVLLVRTVHVEPEYQFSGHVEAPEMGAPAQQSRPSPAQARKANASGNQKMGFWARLKRAFGGSS